MQTQTHDQNQVLIKDVLQKTTVFFREKGIESARLDAELLISSAMKWQRMKLYLNYEYSLSPEELTACRELVKRRSQGEPVAYILGKKDFYNHSFNVSPAVLIPRPETEQIVEEATAWLRTQFVEPSALDVRGANADYIVATPEPIADEADENAESAERKTAPRAEPMRLSAAEVELVTGIPVELEADGREKARRAALAQVPLDARIIDFGTGSGCIGLSLLAELKGAQLVGVDISKDAVAVALDNAEQLGLSERAKFVCADVGELQRGQVTSLFGGRLADAVVANPPYIAENDPSVEKNVRRFEPAGALFSGADGLVHVRAWVKKAAELARSGAFIMFEIGHDQGQAVREIFEATRQFHDIRIVKDMSGRERFIRALRSEN